MRLPNNWVARGLSSILAPAGGCLSEPVVTLGTGLMGKLSKTDLHCAKSVILIDWGFWVGGGVGGGVGLMA